MITTSHVLGTFTLKSETLRVTDPCYDVDTWCAGIVSGCLPGEWEASIEKSEISDWGNRVVSLTVKRVGSVVVDRMEADFGVGVDSGQAGIFDADLYKTDLKAPVLLTGDHEYEKRHYDYRLKEAEDFLSIDPTNERLQMLVEMAKTAATMHDDRLSNPGSTTDFYNACCDKTLSNLGAGTIEYGAVSSSGLGDGGYSCSYGIDALGKAVEIKIDYFEDFDEEDESDE